MFGFRNYSSFRTYFFPLKFTRTKTNKLPFLSLFLARILFSDGTLCFGIGANIAEYVLRTESSEAIVWPIATKCWKYGRHSRLSGKLKWKTTATYINWEWEITRNKGVNCLGEIRRGQIATDIQCAITSHSEWRMCCACVFRFSSYFVVHDFVDVSI